MTKQVIVIGKTIIALIVSVLVGIASAECPPEKVAITKSGVYGAVNPDKYNEMDTAIKNNDQSKLKALIAEKSVSKIPSGKKVCVLEKSFYWYRTKIDVPGFEVSYWVQDDAITEVK